MCITPRHSKEARLKARLALPRVVRQEIHARREQNAHLCPPSRAILRVRHAGLCPLPVEFRILMALWQTGTHRIWLGRRTGSACYGASPACWRRCPPGGRGQRDRREERVRAGSAREKHPSARRSFARARSTFSPSPPPSWRHPPSPRRLALSEPRIGRGGGLVSPVGPIEIYPSAPRNTHPPGHVPFLRARALYFFAAGELSEARAFKRSSLSFPCRPRPGP